jgi:mannose-6-phosphate isomerase class I
VDLFELKEPQEFSTTDDSAKTSVQILVAVEGCGVVEAQGRDPVTLAKGDAVVVPASWASFMFVRSGGRVLESQRAERGRAGARHAHVRPF